MARDYDDNGKFSSGLYHRRWQIETGFAELKVVMNMKHLGLTALKETAFIAAKLLMKGQTNFVKMLWKFNSVYNPERQIADHQKPVKYQMRPPVHIADPKKVAPERLYIIQPSAHQTPAAVH